eukprot:COSAG05_NODE_182_length_14772_cov_42.430655_9_plen_60_part_00
MQKTGMCRCESACDGIGGDGGGGGGGGVVLYTECVSTINFPPVRRACGGFVSALSTQKV